MRASALINKERRQGVRYKVSFPVCLTTMDGTLEGEAVNANRQGVLLETRGRINIRLTIDGQEYRGWLVRAYRVERGTSAYAIELEDDLELPAE